jgi:hypothetical protein
MTLPTDDGRTDVVVETSTTGSLAEGAGRCGRDASASSKKAAQALEHGRGR